MTIGEQIKKIRKAKGLTQKELGERAKIAEPTIRRYELGLLNPKIDTIAKIASALGVYLEDIVQSAPEVSTFVSLRQVICSLGYSLFPDYDTYDHKKGVLFWKLVDNEEHKTYLIESEFLQSIHDYTIAELKTQMVDLLKKKTCIEENEE